MKLKHFLEISIFLTYIIYYLIFEGTNPAPINLRGEPLANNNVENLPIAVIASNRPHYLFRMLRGLLSTPGVDPKMVTIFIDGFYDEPSAIAELFQVSVVEHMPICSKNCRISQVSCILANYDILHILCLKEIA